MAFRILFCLSFLCWQLPAQSCDFDKLFHEGKVYVQQRLYKKALYKYNSARRCDPAKGEKVDQAIEELLDKVENEKKEKDKALELLTTIIDQIVENELEDAARDIYHLCYSDALSKLKSAAELRQKKPEIGRLALEVAFFYTETGQFPAALEAIRLASGMMNKFLRNIDLHQDSAEVLKELRENLKNLDADRFIELHLRYFPNMIQVSADSAFVDRKTCKISEFKLAKTETTFWQFALYATATGIDIYNFSPSWGLNGDNPAINLTWYDAISYTNWLSRRFNLEPVYLIDSTDGSNKDKWVVQINHGANGYRLPCELEWEYAARSGPMHETFEYCGTSDNLTKYAWFRDNSDSLGIARTHSVATRRPNKLGFYDMSGNVWEWCSDWYANYPDTFPDHYTGPQTGSHRVMRSGSWDYAAERCRVAFRGYYPPTYRATTIGLRPALTP